MMLEEKGSKAITSRQACTPTDVSGVVGPVATQYHEVVGLTITFRESETREETIKLLCVVLPDMGTELIIGCPTLDSLGYTHQERRGLSFVDGTWSSRACSRRIRQRIPLPPSPVRWSSSRVNSVSFGFPRI